MESPQRPPLGEAPALSSHTGGEGPADGEGLAGILGTGDSK